MTGRLTEIGLGLWSWWLGPLLKTGGAHLYWVAGNVLWIGDLGHSVDHSQVGLALLVMLLHCLTHLAAQMEQSRNKCDTSKAAKTLKKKNGGKKWCRSESWTTLHQPVELQPAFPTMSITPLAVPPVMTQAQVLVAAFKKRMWTTIIVEV